MRWNAGSEKGSRISARRGAGGRFGITVLLTLTLWASTAWAEDGNTEAEDSLVLREGFHVVRPGDTLEGIARKYLGRSQQWRGNWKLNPNLENPDRIFPGDRLRVLLPESLPPSGALLSKVSRQVEDKLLPLDWEEAELNNILLPRDSLRTFDGASAELLFYDNTHLVLSESSLVVVGDEVPEAQQIERTQIEIVVGQADLAGSLAPGGDQGIEIVLGDARLEPQGNASGEVETRARKVEEGAQVMVYAGESALEAGGQKVQVPEGMGSAVKPGAAPSPPEKLLPAPEGASPAVAARIAVRRPVFSWQPVDGARDYTVEVCSDARCGILLARQTGLTANEWQPANDLPLAALYWRVNATSLSGLDGYPTEASPLEILAVPDDADPPVATLTFTGPQASVNDSMVVGPGFSIGVAIDDAGTGVARWWPIINGLEAAESDLAGPWETGEHTVQVVAVDAVGNQGQSEERKFYYDPDPPQLSWGLQGIGEFGDDLLERFQEEGPEATLQGRRTLQAGGKTWWLDSDFTQVIFRTVRGKLSLPGADVPITKTQGLWVLAEDKPCNGIAKLRYELGERKVTGKRRAVPVLVVEAEDCVENRARIAWPLVADKR